VGDDEFLVLGIDRNHFSVHVVTTELIIGATAGQEHGYSDRES
jgi:hypothetical protein